MNIFSFLRRKLVNILRACQKPVPVYIPTLQSELLNNRVALVTGGTSGIGYAIAKAFLGSGSTVVITGRDEKRLRSACDQLGQSLLCGQNRIFGVEVDNEIVEKFDDGFKQALNLLQGRQIEILVNNAGVLADKGFGEISEVAYNKVLDVNLKGTYFWSQLIANYMKENGIKGNILNIASSSSLRPAHTPYILSKWGVRGLTLGLAKALIPYGIVVNGIAPGPTATPMLIGKDCDSLKHTTSPSGRFATADEIANMAVILVSGMGRMIVGDIVYMTGGCGLITFDDMNY